MHTAFALLFALLTPIHAISNSLQTAIIVVEASHGGAGQDLTNITITVPLTAAYTNTSVLDEVSTLYLTDSTGATLSSITCQAFSNNNGTGYTGPSFNSSVPRLLSTNTVQVGSIVCVSSDISFAPPGPPPGSRPLTTASSTVAESSSSSNFSRTMTKPAGPGGVTSTLVKTTVAGGGGTMTRQTLTSVVAGGGGASSEASAAGNGGPTATTSTPASLATNNANTAHGLSLGSEFFGGLAVLGFGAAFIL